MKEDKKYLFSRRWRMFGAGMCSAIGLTAPAATLLAWSMEPPAFWLVPWIVITGGPLFIAGLTLLLREK